jgi:hypothetical protein
MTRQSTAGDVLGAPATSYPRHNVRSLFKDREQTLANRGEQQSDFGEQTRRTTDNDPDGRTDNRKQAQSQKLEPAPRLYLSTQELGR